MAGHVGQFFFLVDVNHDVAPDGLAQAGAVYFAGLENNVAIGEERDPPPLPAMGEHVK